MIAVPLGKQAVTTAGTPVSITAAALATACTAAGATLPNSGLVHKIEAWADTSDTGISFVKGAGGVKIACLPVPSGGHCEHWQMAARQGNWLNVLAFQWDNSINGDGPFVTVYVE